MKILILFIGFLISSSILICQIKIVEPKINIPKIPASEYHFKKTSTLLNIPTPYNIEDALSYIYGDGWEFKIREIKPEGMMLDWEEINEAYAIAEQNWIVAHFKGVKSEEWTVIDLDNESEKEDISFGGFRKTQISNFPAFIFNYKSDFVSYNYFIFKTENTYVEGYYDYSIQKERDLPKIEDFLNTLTYDSNLSIVSREKLSFEVPLADSLYKIYSKENNLIIYSKDQESKSMIDNKTILLHEEDLENRTLVNVLNDVMHKLKFILDDAKMSKVKSTASLESVQRTVFGKYKGKEAVLYEKVIKLNKYCVAVFLGIAFEKDEITIQEFENIANSFKVK